VSPNLGGAFDKFIWNHIIAQTCENEPFVLESVIAIGALSKAMSVCGANPLYTCPLATPESTNHELYLTAYRYSLKQYNNATRSMKIALADGKSNIRGALITCLLIFCFETYFGNQAAAVRNAQAGILLMHRWQLKEGAFEKLPSNSS